MTEMPELPWRTVHIDFYGPLPSSEYLLVAVNRYSRFPEVEIVHSTRASTVIPKLDKMFSVHGIPDTIISDNGPPSNGDEYARYLLQYRTTPHYTTGVPPSELLFNRVIKGKLPVINSKKIVNRDIKKLETMKKHDKNATENMQIKGETQEK
jgi:hypothetical protein